jgi:hypothetical protein
MAIARGKDVTFDDHLVGVFRVSREQWSHRLKYKQYLHVFDFINHLVEGEGIQVNRVEVLLGKIKVMSANLLRFILYKMIRDN